MVNVYKKSCLQIDTLVLIHNISIQEYYKASKKKNM